MEPDLELSREEMLRVKAAVRARLVRQLHERRITARTLRKAGRHAAAAAETAEASTLLQMIRSLDEPDELAGTRLQEG